MGRRVMEGDVLMPSEPPVVFGLMGGEIVEDDMDVAALIGGDDLVHEGEELDAAAAFCVAADDFASGDIERGEEGRGAVPLIIMRLARHRPSIRQFEVA